jgi:hypothetical protein
VLDDVAGVRDHARQQHLAVRQRHGLPDVVLVLVPGVRSRSAKRRWFR